MTSATCARRPWTTAAIVFASLNAGITAMTRLAEDIAMANRLAGLDRAPGFAADDFFDERRPQADCGPQIEYRAAPDRFALGDVLGRIHAAPLNDDGLFLGRHDAFLAIAERGFHRPDAFDHGREFRHGHGKGMVGPGACAVVGDVLLDHAGAERHGSERYGQAAERIVRSALLADGVVGIADRHFEFIADGHHGLEIGVGHRRRIVGDALQQYELVVAGLAHDADRLPYFIAGRCSRADDHRLAGLGHISDEFEVVDLAGAELVGRHADPF